MTTKKRSRLVLVCDGCHGRKIKCDRQVPCNSCKARGIGELCRYSAIQTELAKQGKVVTTDPTVSEVAKLSNRIEELEAMVSVLASPGSSSHSPSVKSLSYGEPPSPSVDDDYTIPNFFFPSTDDSIMRKSAMYMGNHLSFFMVLAKDNAHNAFWYTNGEKFHKKKIALCKLEGVGQLLDKDPEHYKTVEKKCSVYFGDSYIPNNAKPSFEVKKAINAYQSQFGRVMFFDNYISDCSLYLKASYILPSREIIFRYMEVWFQRLGPYFPIVEQVGFSKAVGRIILERDNNSPGVRLNIEVKSDLAVLSCLLYLLRLTYLYMVSIGQKSTNMDLAAFPIYVDVISIARECLKEIPLSQVPIIEVLEAHTFAKVHKEFSHDEGDGVREGDTYVRILIPYAIACGLHRDPGVETPWMDQNRRRKLWFFLVSLELYEVAVFGREMTSLTCSNVNLEKVNIPGDDGFYHAFSRSLSLRAILQKLTALASDLTKGTGVDQFANLTSQFESVIESSYGPFVSRVLRQVEIQNDPKSVLELYHLFSFKICCLRLNYALYLVYEKKGDVQLSYKYYSRVMEIFFGEFFPSLAIIFENKDHIDPMLFMFTRTIFTRLFIVFLLFSVTAIIHMNHTIRYQVDKEGVEPPKFYYDITSNIRRLWSYACSFCGFYANRFFTYWTIVKMLMLSMETVDMYLTFPSQCEGYSARWMFTVPQMQHLAETIENATVSCKPKSWPAQKGANFEWLQLIPYDDRKSLQENLETQRLHINQIDATWNVFGNAIQDPIPDTFKNTDAYSDSQVSSLMDPDMNSLDFFGVGFPSSLKEFVMSEDYFRV
ncbi:hypothetical protein CANTEDRAFT_133644 [Yamadazyma tenuis ATCC 10573]|uniref:Zn(2)-C6 fungal-type domain-containing protein n=1 Tax=Candida tenuis (strain ATCC 10573 / BCRC 21748 / CBS 615 / JCM 9827 / NBRC 10315 / NRRL Y-1498 / VKM Y-70) TaxID=590646 RepID=G3B089_CANTC|nr:uncharacterized protein CANTEDRAFT_133644 [Yamadazyma tenuis ATCC 10573]EGV65345.1 hypothetical protein CANTEDRAFT_133644 [Yamadazyma tenuis ATCC 10573]